MRSEIRRKKRFGGSEKRRIGGYERKVWTPDGGVKKAQ